MKALSIRQPWAWAILNGKDVENRTWPTHYTGPILIHASKTFDFDGYRWILENRHLFSVDIPQRDNFLMGGFIGKTNIIDCVSYFESPFFFGPWGFVFEGTEPIDFVRARGRLGLFDVLFYDKIMKGAS